jgi:hypothetical protein
MRLLEILHEVRGESSIAIELEHVVDEHTGIGEGYEATGSDGADEHECFAGLVKHEYRLEGLVAEASGVIGDERHHLLGERMLAHRPGEREIGVASQAPRFTEPRATAFDVEHLEQAVPSAKVVGQREAATDAEKIRQRSYRQIGGGVEPE